MWWCVAILLAATEPPHAHAHMVLSYDHLEPDPLPWTEVGTGHRLDPQVAQVRLAMFVVETARDLAAQRNDSAPRRQPRSRPRTQTADLVARVKGEVYKKVLQQTLAHTQKTYKQLVSSAASSSVKEAMLRQWLEFVSDSDMALRVLHSLRDGEQSSLQNEKRKEKTGNSHESESHYKQEKLEDKPVLTHSNTRKKITGQDLISLLMGTVLKISGSSNSSTSSRFRRSDQGLMYLPIGGTTKVQCPTAADAAGVSIAQMAFLSICLTVFNVIVNINNNINNNNNNNNINSDNNLSNNNAELSLNVNNAGQVNVMLPPPIPGRKRRASSLRAKWQDEAKASGLSRWAESETSEQALEHILLSIDKKQGIETSALADGDEALVKAWDRKSESKKVRKELRTAKATANRKETVVVDNVQGTAEPTADSNSTDASTRPAFEAATEPSVGDSAEDFSLPTPVPGVLGTWDRSSKARASSWACEKGGRKGVASGLLRAVKEWALEAPLLPLQCRGLLWCRGLREASTQKVWLHVLASFAAHQRTRDRQVLTLRQFTAAALADNTCEQLFPTCKQTAVP